MEQHIHGDKGYAIYTLPKKNIMWLICIECGELIDCADIDDETRMALWHEKLDVKITIGG